MEGEGLPDKSDDGQRRRAQSRARRLGGLAGLFAVAFGGLLALTINLTASKPTPPIAVISNFGFSLSPGATETITPSSIQPQIQAASRSAGSGPRTVFVTVTHTVTKAPARAVQAAGHATPVPAAATSATPAAGPVAAAARPTSTTTVYEAVAPPPGSGTSPWAGVAAIGTGCSGFAAILVGTAAILALRKHGAGTS